MSYFSIIGLILGVFYGGFSGGFVGLLLGWFIDGIVKRAKFQSLQQTQQRARKQYYSNALQFESELLSLIAYVAKSDNNRLRQSELEYCKSYFRQTFPHSDLAEMMRIFKELLNGEDIKDKCMRACDNIRQYATIHEKLSILQVLFGFAMADSAPDSDEIEAIRDISDHCGIDRSTFEAMKLLYVGFNSSYYGSGGSRGSYGGGYGSSGGYERRVGPSLDDCYKILEVSPNASDEEVKKAYRSVAMKHHPDRVSHLGEDVRKQAEEKFAKINEAYDKIKAYRGIK